MLRFSLFEQQWTVQNFSNLTKFSEKTYQTLQNWQRKIDHVANQFLWFWFDFTHQLLGTLYDHQFHHHVRPPFNWKIMRYVLFWYLFLRLCQNHLLVFVEKSSRKNQMVLFSVAIICTYLFRSFDGKKVFQFKNFVCRFNGSVFFR